MIGILQIAPAVLTPCIGTEITADLGTRLSNWYSRRWESQIPKSMRASFFHSELKAVDAFVNNRTAVFYMVHCADTDKEARENVERGFMSYVNTIFTVNGQLQAAVKEGTRDAAARRGQPAAGGISAGGQHGLPAAQSHGHLWQPRHLHRAGSSAFRKSQGWIT